MRQECESRYMASGTSGASSPKEVLEASLVRVSIALQGMDLPRGRVILQNFGEEYLRQLPGKAGAFAVSVGSYLRDFNFPRQKPFQHKANPDQPQKRGEEVIKENLITASRALREISSSDKELLIREIGETYYNQDPGKASRFFEFLEDNLRHFSACNCKTS